MYENGIDVAYEVAQYDDQGREIAWQPGKVTLPGWCAGEPDAALALYLFGRVDHRSELNVLDWAPVEAREAANRELEALGKPLVNEPFDPDVEVPLAEHPLFPGIVDEDWHDGGIAITSEHAGNCACVLCHSDRVGAWA